VRRFMWAAGVERPKPGARRGVGSAGMDVSTPLCSWCSLVVEGGRALVSIPIAISIMRGGGWDRGDRRWEMGSSFLTSGIW
jgi:hypothetical protein